MELKDYLKILAKYWLWLVITAVILTAVFFGLSQWQKNDYLASTTMAVIRNNDLEQKDILAASLFSQMVATWFSSPTMVNEIFDLAGVSLPPLSQNQLGKIFEISRQEPATINLRVKGKDMVEIEKIVNAAVSLTEKKIADSNQGNKESYRLIKFNTLVSSDKPNVALYSIFGLISGLLLGILVAFSANYFQKK